MGRMTLADAVGSVLLLVASAGSAFAITMTERVDCERRIQAVYQAHRIGNPSHPRPRPSALPEHILRTRVLRTLAERSALERFWNWQLDAVRVQEELNRVARNTRAPEVLRELFQALSGDPALIAECVIVPELVQREFGTRFPRDPRIHGGLRRSIEKRLATIVEPAGLAGVSDEYREIDVTAEDERLRGIRSSPRVVEEDGRFVAYIVVSRDDRSVRLGIASWSKASPDEWLKRAGYWDSDPPPLSSELVLPDISGVTCEPNLWSSTPVALQVEARTSHAAVWTGSEMIVWGGQTPVETDLGTGLRYRPATDSWVPVALEGAPSARRYPGAVWTGTEMIVWGGYSREAGAALGTGGRYDPALDRWTPMSTSPYAKQRSGHQVTWTGTEMIVWGGTGDATGALYDPSSDSWRPTSTVGTPNPGLAGQQSVWTGTEMIVWGGKYPEPPKVSAAGDNARYNPVTDTWRPVTTAGAPLMRDYHTLVWTGTEMIVWGGEDWSYGYLDDGKLYNPATDTWRPMSGTAAPSPRLAHRAVWTGSRMVVWGGLGWDGACDSGGRYDPLTDTWTATSLADSPSARHGHTATWTGAEMIVWGGYGADPMGGRYDVETDSWRPTVASGGPVNRREHTAIWTGSEMIVWGGTHNAASLADGYRYDPALDVWWPVSTVGSPRPRWGHRAVWTGTEMFVCLGSDSGCDVYDPLADRWRQLPGAPALLGSSIVWTGRHVILFGGTDASSRTFYDSTARLYDTATGEWTSTTPGSANARSHHSAVWTGDEMVIWGGRTWSGKLLSDGLRYDPEIDAWAPLPASSLAPRAQHTATWTGQEMIIFGGVGYNGVEFNNGRRFDPASDTWAWFSSSGAPSPRSTHIAVWSGREMVVWGGAATATGGRYSPEGDFWLPTTTEGAPAPRSSPAAVWAGDRMIVWGGGHDDPYEDLDTGGALCGCLLARPAPIVDLRLSRTGTTAVVAWSAVTGATGYDVVAGGTTDLRASGGNFSTSTTRCLADDQPSDSVVDPLNPVPGDATWYLARGVNCTVASYDESSPAQQGRRDSEIRGSTSACP